MADFEEFEAHRAMLLGLAYRMLGSYADAEDAVQDAWLRWQRTDSSDIQNSRAFLCTTVTRLCIDRLSSAQARRETYVGPWLPEPVVTQAGIDPESVSMAFLVLLERLTPTERAVVVLHRVFDYAHIEVAAMLGITEHAARQALYRASQQLPKRAPRFEVDADRHRQLLSSFLAAIRSGDVNQVATLLAEDVTLWADGGGKVQGAASKPVTGAASIARFFLGLAARFPELNPLCFEEMQINGQGALVARMGAQVIAVMAFETNGTHITAIRNILNPEKLRLSNLSR